MLRQVRIVSEQAVVKAAKVRALPNQNSSPRQLLGMSWAHFLNDGSANYLPGILPAILLSLNEPVSMAGAIMASLMIGQALQPFFGWVADRVGGKKLIIIGLFGSSLGGALLGFAQHNLLFLIGLLLVIGVGNSMFHPQALAAVRSIVQKRQGLSLSLFLIGGELGRGIWPTVTSWIVVQFGLINLWVTVIPALITLPFLFKFAPHLPAKRGPTAKIKWSQHVFPMMGLVGYSSTRSLVVYGLVTFIPLLWHQHGGSLVSGASIITTLLAVGVIGNLSGGHVADRLGRRPVMTLSSIFVTILAPFFLFISGAWIWIIAALLGIMLFSSAPVTVLIGQDIFPENRSMGSGIALGLANGIGSMLVFVVGFFVTEKTIESIFWILAVVSLLSIVFSLIIPKSLMSHSVDAHH
jgi:FSR family fosmidomycin resistance protein-like MFS transporter